MATALLALYAGLAVVVGAYWRHKGVGFAAGTLWSILVTPVGGFAIGLLLGPDRPGAGGERRARRRWIPPAAILLVMFAASVCVVSTGERYGGHGRSDRARTDVRRIASDGVEAFRAAHGRYPTTDEGLQILIREGLLRPNAPDGGLWDPWGRPYEYERPGRVHPGSFDVRSYGADGRPGGEGQDADVYND